MKAANDNWPIVLTRPQAAEMCRVGLSTFDRWVARGILPPAIAGTRRWSRDKIIVALSGDHCSGADSGDVSAFEEWKRSHAH